MRVKFLNMTQIHPQIEIYQKILAEQLQPYSIEIIDDSHQHAGHAGHNSAGASHLTLHVVSDKFTYDILGDWMKSHIHALVINAKTPSEK
jgi:BolA family transcriptional regulator, general stress-responsive regulator